MAASVSINLITTKLAILIQMAVIVTLQPKDLQNGRSRTRHIGVVSVLCDACVVVLNSIYGDAVITKQVLWLKKSTFFQH